MSNAEMDRALQTLRTVVAAMALGIVGFGGLVAFLVMDRESGADSASLNMMLLVLGALAVGEIPAYALVRKAIVGNLRRGRDGLPQGDVPVEEILKSFNTITLIGCAMAESVSLLGLVTLLITGEWLVLIAPVIGLVLLGLQFPTRSKFTSLASQVTGRFWS